MGRPGNGYDKVFSKAAHSEVADDIIFTGYIPSNESKVLYRNAAAYVFPSIYEGFGSTQLECMVNNLPLICSNIPTNKEISNDYGLFFNLNDIDSLVMQMKRIVQGKYDYEAKAKVADSILERFKWENVIDEYIDVYKRAVNDM